MTDTNTFAPTDAEIIALADETRTGEPGRDGYILPISFARAVLAEWGAPAPAASEPVAVPAGIEPVAWRLHPFDYGIGSEGVYALPQTEHLRGTWIKKGWAPEPLYTAAQVQAMLSAAPRNATLYDPHDVAFPAPRSADEGDALSPELASIAKQASTAAAEVAAPAQAGEYPPLVCDYCGALTPDPWHSSGMLHGKMSKHIHSCDACEALAAPAQPVAGQSQFAGDGEWSKCAVEHVTAVLAAPHEWSLDYKVRYLYAAAPSPAQAQDEALIWLMLAALEHHTQQTRPIARTDDAITAALLRLNGMP